MTAPNALYAALRAHLLPMIRRFGYNTGVPNNDDSSGSGESSGDDEATYDPNRLAIWPTYPAGTRLPVPKWSRRKDALMLLVVLAMLARAGYFIYWIIDAVHHR